MINVYLARTADGRLKVGVTVRPPRQRLQEQGAVPIVVIECANAWDVERDTLRHFAAYRVSPSSEHLVGADEGEVGAFIRSRVSDEPARRGRGRPTMGAEPCSAVLRVYCTPAQRDSWHAAAKARGISLSDWTREVMDRWADGVLGAEVPGE